MRKFDWSVLVVLAGGFNIPYAFGFFPYLCDLKTGYLMPNHFLAFLIGLGFSTFLLTGCFMNIFAKLSQESYYRRRKWWERVLSEIGFLSTMLLMVTSMLLLVLSPETIFFRRPDISTNTLLFQCNVLYWIVGIHSFLLLYSAFCIFFLWSRKRVESGTLVKVNSVSYFPPEKYFVNPFFKNTIEIIELDELR